MSLMQGTFCTLSAELNLKQGYIRIIGNKGILNTAIVIAGLQTLKRKCKQKISCLLKMLLELQVTTELPGQLRGQLRGWEMSICRAFLFTLPI
jgi:hypothetical protein